jgi:hypothetical protein
VKEAVACSYSVLRWVIAYTTLMRDEYPPFRLER